MPRAARSRALANEEERSEECSRREARVHGLAISGPLSSPLAAANLGGLACLLVAQASQQLRRRLQL